MRWRAAVGLGAVIAIAAGCQAADQRSSPDLLPIGVGHGIRIEGELIAGWGATLPAAAQVALWVRLADKPTRYRLQAWTIATGTRYLLDVAGPPPADTIEAPGYVLGALLVYRATATLPEFITDGELAQELIGGTNDAILYKAPGASGPKDPWLADFPDDSWACSGPFGSMATDLGTIRVVRAKDCGAMDLAVLGS